MRIRNRWTFAAAAFLAAAMLAVAPNPSRAQGPALKVGDTIPDLSSTDMQGKRVRLSDYKGKVLLVDFWATWCPPCRAEVPGVVKAYNKYNKQGFEILGISLDQSKDPLNEYTKQQGMKWRQVYDRDSNGALSTRFKVQYIPTVYLVDGTTGKVLATDVRGEKLEPAVAAALKKKGR